MKKNNLNLVKVFQDKPSFIFDNEKFNFLKVFKDSNIDEDDATYIESRYPREINLKLSGSLRNSKNIGIMLVFDGHELQFYFKFSSINLKEILPYLSSKVGTIKVTYEQKYSVDENIYNIKELIAEAR